MSIKDAVNLGFWAYLKAAFNARFWGMFISPSWVILAAFVFLGVVVNPGFFLIGVGIELSYLFTIASHPRFQRYIQSLARGKLAIAQKAQWQSRTDKLIQQLDNDSKKRFYSLENRCNSILDFYSTQLMFNEPMLEHHKQSLNKLIWIFLQLLVTRQAVEKLMEGAVYPKNRKSFDSQIEELDKQINKDGISEELRKSLEGKRDIIKMRLQALAEADQKLTYINAELERIEQQAELLREQAIINRDSQGISSRIESVSLSLNQTSDWIKQQEGFLGTIENISGASPAILSERPNIQEKQ